MTLGVLLLDWIYHVPTTSRFAMSRFGELEQQPSWYFRQLIFGSSCMTITLLLLQHGSVICQEELNFTFKVEPFLFKISSSTLASLNDNRLGVNRSRV